MAIFKLGIRSIGIVLLVLAGFGPDAGRAWADGEELKVDNDLAECKDAQYTTIQSAVTAAAGRSKTI